MQHQTHYGKEFYLDRDTGYWISSNCPKIRAHRWVWINNHGQIPKGYHIHHKDGDKSNNSIENLELIEGSRHLSLHGREEKNRKRASAWCEVIRPLTKEWHASEEGHQWHSKHAKETFTRKNPTYNLCEVCKKQFGVDQIDSYKSRFCSNACKSKWRRDSGLDDIEKECFKCKKLFMSNKYAKRMFCSKSCGCGRPQNKIN